MRIPPSGGPASRDECVMPAQAGTTHCEKQRFPPLLGLSAQERALVVRVLAESQADLATLSSSRRQGIAGDAMNYRRLGQPKVVIDAIRDLIQTAQG